MVYKEATMTFILIILFLENILWPPALVGKKRNLDGSFTSSAELIAGITLL